MNRTFFLLLFSLQTAVVFAQNTPKIAPADSLLATRQVDSLLKVARVFLGKQDFEKALEANAAAEKVALDKLGRESSAIGRCCHDRGLSYYLQGNKMEAEKWYLEALRVRENVLGKENADYAQTLFNLAITYMQAENFEKSEAFFLACRDIRKRVLGAEHQDYANCLGNLAGLYWEIGNFEKAEPIFSETLNIEERNQGTESTEYATTLNNFSMLYRDMGNYEMAMPMLLASKAIRERILGKEHPQYARILNNLGILYMLTGDFVKSEAHYLENKSIIEKTLGVKHGDYAYCLNNLAILAKKMGDFSKSAQFYQEAKSIFEETVGKEHSTYANCINNFATLYFDMGKYAEAEVLYTESQTLIEKKLGKEHPDYARCLLNIGALYQQAGNDEQAERLYLEGLYIKEKALGKHHPDYAKNLHSLGKMYLKKGEFDKAEPVFLESTAVRKETLGNQHPDYAASLTELATLYENQNRLSESEPLLHENFILSSIELAKSTAFLSEQELAKYAVTFREMGDNLSSYLLSRQSKNEQKGILPALIFDHALFQKGFLLTTTAHRHSPTNASPESAEINLRLKGYRRRLAAEYAKPIAVRKGVAELEEKANTSEKELARTVAGYAENARQVRWQEVQNNLQTDEVAIEFVHFRVNFPKATDSVMYAALILKKDSPQPAFIPLFEEKALDTLLKISGERKLDYVNRVYGAQNTGEKTLYQMLWQPLENELAGVKKVYFSPSGLLHRLKLGAIPISKNEILSDRYRFVQAGSTRQLLENHAPATNYGDEAELFGGIQFGMDEIAITKANMALAARNVDGMRGELDFSKTDSTTRGGDWAYLNWTEVEVALLQPILASAGLKTTLFKGFSATEEAFKSMHSPRILHIATHGYFFPDVSREQREEKGESAFKISEHPMIRSGLILAGGNHAWKNGSPLKPSMEDGILTAYEISQMDLSNTELVVLSACETGLGDIQGNEGVYGLQRAFKIAGAKYLIMSLWQVPDFQTQELMMAFYDHYLTEKMPLPEAFRVAQHEMREKYNLPLFWASFVLLE